jgi:ABC-type nitrate/sulfonate/bicarbonate transport system ATPase subunit
LFQGVPPILWAIPLILILGVGAVSPILVIALICFPLVALNTAEGMKSVPGELAQMLQVFAPGIYPRLRELVLPHLAPFLAASLNLGLVLGVKSSVVAEFFGANNGIGFQIQAAYQALQVGRLFSWGLILVLLVTLLDRLLARLKAAGERRRARAVLGRQRRRRRGAAGESRGGGLPAEATAEIRQTWAGLLTRHPPGRLRLAEVSFSYQTGEARLLEGIGLTVDPGEVAVICGESGVGKTTLLKIVAGLLQPGSGRVEAPARLGVVFQDDRFLPWRSNLWNVALPLVYQRLDASGGRAPSSRTSASPLAGTSGMPPAAASTPDRPLAPLGTRTPAASARLASTRRPSRRAGRPCLAAAVASYLLEEVGLDGQGGKLPAELSGGMRKRLAFARCFARLPEAILMDEPFTGLHREARVELWDKFFHLHGRHPVPVVIVTHFPEEVPCPGRCTYYTLQGRPARLQPGPPPQPQRP